MYYKISIACTAKSYKPDDEYRTFDKQLKCFDTIEEALDYLKTRYGSCKRVKQYLNNPNGEPYQSGWIYCFNNEDASYSPADKWRQQDWVTICRVEETVLVPSVIGW